VYRFTHLGRTFRLSVPAHAGVVALSLAAAAAGMAFPAGRSPMRAALEAGGATFLTWALARELDPDRPLTGLVSAAAGAVAVVVTGEASLAGLTGLLIGSRILVRSTGLIPRLTDIGAVGVFVGVVARDPVTWAAGLLVAGAVAGDAFLPDPAPPRQVWLALAIGVAVTLGVVISEALPRSWEAPDVVSVMYAVAGIAAGASAPPTPLSSVADRGRAPLIPVRLRAARWSVVGAAALATSVGGGASSRDLWPVWLTLVVVGVAARVRPS
jgi:hypothetical protein